MPKNCDSCLEEFDESLTATHHCTTCKKNICEAHLELHLNHILTALQPYNNQSTTTTSVPSVSNPSLSNFKQKDDHCKDHPNQLLEICCRDCDDIIICVKCALFKHKLHNYVELKNIVNEEKENINKLYKELSIKKEIILQRRKSIDQSIQNVKKKDKYEEKVYSNFNNLNKELNTKKNNLLTELENVRHNKLCTLQNEIETLHKIFNNLNKLCDFSSDNAIDILQHKKELEKQLNNLNNLKVLSDLNEMTDINLNIEKDKKKLINLINLKNTSPQNYFNFIKFEEITKYGETRNNELNYSNDIKFYKGLIYIVETDNYRILILDNLLKYKNEIKLNSKPLSLEVDEEYLYVGCSDSKNNQINIYNLNSLQLFKEIKDNNKFKRINGIATDKNNNLYICNSDNKEVIIFNKNYEFIKQFKTKNNLQPHRIIINNKNQIVINGYKEIQVYTNSGESISNNKFDHVLFYGIICDSNDNYLICDRGKDCLLILDSNFNKIKEFKGSLDKPISAAYNETKNQIYVLDVGEQCIKLFK